MKENQMELPELKNTILKIKILLNKSNSRLHTRKENITNHKDTEIEIIYAS